MAVQTIDNLRNRSKSIVEEVRANSVDGPRLGNLLTDFVDTVEDLSKRVDSKINTSDISLNMHTEEEVAGKVADVRLIRRLLERIRGKASVGEIVNYFSTPTLISSLSNGDILNSEDISAILLLRLVVRDTNGVIYHTQIISNEAFSENSPKYQIHTSVFHKQYGKMKNLCIELQIRNGVEVKFHSDDDLDINNFIIDIERIF